jgi:hypothetical protein
MIWAGAGALAIASAAAGGEPEYRHHAWMIA